MKLKLLLGAVAIVAVLYAANQLLNSGPASRGSLETSASVDPEAKTTPLLEREKFRVGFLPVT